MSGGPIVVTPDERPKALDLLGEDMTVLASGAQAGSYEIFLQVGHLGSGPPPHHHPWDEAFYVVRGEVAFGNDGEESTAGPGTLVHIPGGTTHWFKVGDAAQRSPLRVATKSLLRMAFSTPRAIELTRPAEIPLSAC